MTRPVYLGKLFTVQFDDALVSIGHLVTSLLPKLKQRHKHCFQFHAGALRLSQQIFGKIYAMKSCKIPPSFPLSISYRCKFQRKHCCTSI